MNPPGAAIGSEQRHDEGRYGEPGMGTADTHMEHLAYDTTVLCENPLIRVQLSPRTVLFLHAPLHKPPQHIVAKLSPTILWTLHPATTLPLGDFPYTAQVAFFAPARSFLALRS
ncbi:hypothetical protein [Actinacidiphila glaucinigra]|uniref:hypothetical protein n=1 Tax=Actinacidiphila glaucinigra TaxID=235986 RepID=UPI0035D8B4BB